MVAGLKDMRGGMPARARRDPETRTATSRRDRFRAIYDANYHLILGYALRRTEHREDAEDIVADTFLVAWRRFDDMPRGAEARLWLYGVARGTLANHHRTLRRRDRLHGRLESEVGLQAPPPAADRARPAAVATAFSRLGDDDREVLSLLGWEGLDAGEIATVVGCSRNAARIRVHRARRRFAKELAAAGFEPRQLGINHRTYDHLPTGAEGEAL
jgi:RNA polymerase sigma-70 factor (ECF subfamily)